MFGSKYIFETRKTKTLRYLKNLGFLFFILFLLYLFSGLFFVLTSKKEAQKTAEIFYQSHPDLIVVFTGATGRIPHALELAKKFKQSHIFITGVYSKNSINTLVAPLKIDGELNMDLLEIDYWARNTIENALSTIRYLRQSKSFKRVIIVSHDYHIPRIKTIMKHMTRNSSGYKFFYEGVPSDFTQMKNLKTLYREVYKWIRTFGFLIIWDTDPEQVTPE